MDAIAGLLAEQPFWIWAGLAAAILAVEVVTGSGWLLWASASAAATAAVVGLADISLPTALLVFALLTMVSTLLARRWGPGRASRWWAWKAPAYACAASDAGAAAGASPNVVLSS